MTAGERVSSEASTDPDVSVIVVSWNGRRYLEACLRAVEGQRDVRAEIMLVDNGSTDGTVDLVRSTFPRVRIVRLEQNRGFAGGNNAGAHEARGEFLAFLNNDTVPESTWLSTAATAASIGRPALRWSRRASSTCTTPESSTAPAMDSSGRVPRSSGTTASAPRQPRRRWRCLASAERPA